MRTQLSSLVGPYASKLGKDFLRGTTGRAGSLMLPPPQRFVIWSNGRSGSNLLVRLLRQHPAIRIHGELFGEYRLHSEPLRKMIRERGPKDYLDREFRRLTTEKAVGHKIHYGHLTDEYGAQFDLTDLPALREAMLADDSYRFINLKRQNRLAWLVSKHLAMANTNWNEGRYEIQKVRIDPQAALADVEGFVALEKQFEAVLPSERTMELHYKQMVDDTADQISRVFRFLGLAPVPVEKTLRKQNRRKPEETVENYEELKAAFAGTPYADIFPA